jgi:hypothetical protein
MTWFCCFVVSAIALGPQQPATRQPPDPTRQSSETPDLPVSIERIQRALAAPPGLRLDSETPRFRVEVFGRKPTIQDFLGTVRTGPVPRGSSAHQEFLKMVTPDDVRGYAAFSNQEGAVVAVSSFANAMLISAIEFAIKELKAAKKAHDRQAARREVAAALAALERARKDAGLPPK